MFSSISKKIRFLSTGAALTCFFAVATSALAADPAPLDIKPPAIQREMRGIWVSSVFNGNWPSSKRLTTAQQKSELIGILNRAVRLNCNAVFLQVRPMCDALYASKIEPWSEYLTGEMGKAPNPYYDPLEFAVTEAHKRGLELHAWFNPYRAHPIKTPVSADHVSKKHPEFVREYGKFLWLDPTEPATREYSLSVIRDVVRRYDIDGVHFDDYFYPYRENDAQGKELDFPDDAAWKRYKSSGGKLSRSDWRRENVNLFIQMVQQMIRQEKPWIKYGISPFGIWQSGYPAGTKGLSAYESLFADSRKWLANGWVDYLAPQLYWAINAQGQSFPALLKWWAGQNAQHRHVWAGMRVDRDGAGGANEAVAEIKATRNQPGASGNLLWHTRAIMQDKNKIVEALEKEVYSQPALSPAYPWLNSTPPATPEVEAKKTSANLIVKWRPGGGKIWLWALQVKQGTNWTTTIIPGSKSAIRIKLAGGEAPEAVALTAVNRFGNASAPVVATVK